MVWAFLVVCVLVAILLVPNGLYAFRQFLVRRDLVWLVVYFGFLIGLGYLLIRTTYRLLDIVQTAKETVLRPDY